MNEHNVWNVSAAILGALLGGSGAAGLGAVSGHQPAAVMVAMWVLSTMLFCGGVLLGLDFGWRIRGGAERRVTGSPGAVGDVDHDKGTP